MKSISTRGTEFRKGLNIYIYIWYNTPKCPFCHTISQNKSVKDNKWSNDPIIMVDNFVRWVYWLGLVGYDILVGKLNWKKW